MLFFSISWILCPKVAMSCASSNIYTAAIPIFQCGKAREEKKRRAMLEKKRRQQERSLQRKRRRQQMTETWPGLKKIDNDLIQPPSYRSAWGLYNWIGNWDWAACGCTSPQDAFVIEMQHCPSPCETDTVGWECMRRCTWVPWMVAFHMHFTKLHRRFIVMKAPGGIDTLFDEDTCSYNTTY